jgi:hypothetical protein
VKLGFVSLREEYRSRGYKVKILRRTFEREREKETGGWRK